MEYEFSLKDIDDVVLKATYKIEIGNRTIEPGEIIAAFDHLELNNYHEVVKTTTAHGGFDDRARVWWETTDSIKVSFSQGTFSPTQLTLFANAKLLNVKPNSVTITKREKVETDENYQFELKETPSGKIFVYDQDTGDKVEFSVEDKVVKIITTDEPYKTYIVDYEWTYVDGAQLLKVGQRLLNGYVTLEGRTRIKEEHSGQVKTAIIKIPKLKLRSNLSMRLGKDTVPVVGGFSGDAIPVGERGNTFAMELFLLEDDIDSDF